MKRTLIIVTVFALLVNSCRTTHREITSRGDEAFRMGSINRIPGNLLGIDADSGKMLIDVLLAKTPEYEVNVSELDFVFKHNYAHFELTRTRFFLDHETVSISGWYRDTSIERGQTTVELTFASSGEEAREMMRRLPSTFSSGMAFRSELDIGDFAIGGSSWITFIRGNVMVRAGRGTTIIIEDLARAIDNQLLDILNGEITRRDVRRGLERRSDRIVYNFLKRREFFGDFMLKYLDIKHYNEHVYGDFRLHTRNDDERGSIDAYFNIRFDSGRPRVEIREGNVQNIGRLSKQINRIVQQAR